MLLPRHALCRFAAARLRGWLLCLWGCLALLLGAAPAWAIDIDVRAERQPLDSVGALYAESAPLTLDQVLTLEPSRWRQVNGSLNFGYTDTIYWYRVPLTNPSDKPLNRLLEMTYPLLDHVEFYQVADGKLIQQFETGDAKPFAQRPLVHRNFVFPLTLEANQQQEIYFRIQTAGALQAPLIVWEERAFHAASERGLTGRALFYGVLLVMAAFNLFLYFSLREVAYLYYVFVVLSTLLLMTGLHGVSFQYLYPRHPDLHQLVILLIVPFCEIALGLFTIEFLALRQTRPYWYRVFLVLISLAALCVLSVAIFSYSIATRLSVYLAIPTAFASLAASLFMWRRGLRSASLFATAWMSLLIGVLLTILNKIGLLPTNFLTEHGIPIGATVQAMLFAFALANRFNSEREALFKAQQDNLEAMRRKQEVEAQLLYTASHHEITGLPNRPVFEKAVQPYLDKTGTQSYDLAVVLLHLRRFDDVNKTLGHRNADKLVRQVAQRLNFAVSTCAGAILLESNADQPAFTAHVEGVSFAFAVRGASAATIIPQVEAVAQDFDQPVEFMGLSLDLSYVIGCSFMKGRPLETQTLLREAFVAFDQADTEAKRVAVYEPEMNPYNPRRLTLMTELRTALEKDGLELFFQPQIHLPSFRVAGFEALLRWSHPQHGFIPPDEFIPMAEQTGLMKPLTRWVIAQALAFCKELDRLGCDATVAVNISALNLRESSFCDQVLNLLFEHEVAAERLVLEVTETAAMADPKSALGVLRELQSARIRLSIDDFGTGHSSLSYIRKLPVQEIKIDRSFVMEMSTSQGDATIVRTTINMCHDLGYEVVAEGVENEATVKLLSSLGCDFIQGYHIARPMNRDNAVAWLQQTSWRLNRVPSERGANWS